ncbi:chromosome segregation protein SMC [[Flavobacterium] thermophilum]|nr:chromosome segregation protein SMC [[Flavobacterium] thermophilum]
MSHELVELLRSVLKEELQPIHERLDRLEAGQQRLEERQQRLEERQHRLEERQQRLEERQQRLEERQQRLEEKLDHFIIETRSHFKKIEDELAEHRRMFEILSHDWRNANIAIEYLNHKIGQHDLEMYQLKKRLELQETK